jgi:hypothetical protein
VAFVLPTGPGAPVRPWVAFVGAAEAPRGAEAGPWRRALAGELKKEGLAKCQTRDHLYFNDNETFHVLVR